MSKTLVIDGRFKLGDSVEALDQDGITWRPARLVQHAPYLRTGSDGYYVQWRDRPVTSLSTAHLSEGGWKPAYNIRPVTVVSA